MAALTAAQIQAQIDALDKAYASGATSVDYPGKVRIQYRSVQEYQVLRSELLARLADANVTAGGGTAATRTRRIVVTTRSGW